MNILPPHVCIYTNHEYICSCANTLSHTHRHAQADIDAHASHLFTDPLVIQGGKDP